MYFHFGASNPKMENGPSRAPCSDYHVIAGAFRPGATIPSN